MIAHYCHGYYWSWGFKWKPSCVIAPTTTFFCPRPSSKSIIITVIQVMGSEYLTSLKSTNCDEVEAKIQGPSMIYKGIEWLYGTQTLEQEGGELWKCYICSLVPTESSFHVPYTLMLWRRRRPCVLSRSILHDHILPWFV